MSPLPGLVETFLREQQLLGCPGVVAVSGGPDSTVLAHLLAQQAGQGHTGPLVFAHLNHQLRGDDSVGDEAFVLHLPKAWQSEKLVHAVSRRHDTGGQATQLRENLESHARQVRYAWLEEVAREAEAAWIATGHTADDQAETVLHRVLRGTGLRGLGGMAPCRNLTGGLKLVRPLLTASRQDVLAYAQENNLAFRVDQSNQDRRFTRNLLRWEVLPLLQRDFNPNLVETLNHLAQQAREVQQEIGGWARRLLQAAELPAAAELRIFSLDQLAETSDFLLVEMFQQVWQREGWPLGEMGFEPWRRLVAVVRGHPTAWDFPGGVSARRRGRVIQVGKKP